MPNATEQFLQIVGEKAQYGTVSQMSLPQTVGNLINIFLSILGSLFILLIVYGGYIWLMARGDDKQVEKARDIIKQALIGLVIILAAYSITAFVVSRLVPATGGLP